MIQSHIGPKLTFMWISVNNSKNTNTNETFTKFCIKILCFHLMDQSDIGTNREIAIVWIF
jgi:hypothetical protein